MMLKACEWLGSSVRFLDQTRLPLEERYIETTDPAAIAEAIRSLKIRGAPLIGIAAAYAIALGALYNTSADPDSLRTHLRSLVDLMASTRPTAVNLFSALRRITRRIDDARTLEELRSSVVGEALLIHREDESMCREIGVHGSRLIPDQATILTHCNTGALATGGEGTAQCVITTAAASGKRIRVFADETRPLLQGARLTAWELQKAGIDVTIITDGMAGFILQREKVSLVIVGADRIAANGDTANKIGTYTLAIAAGYHHVPFYVAAPSSTIDPAIPSGELIPIEERNPDEVTNISGRRIAPAGVPARNPSFDVTPSGLISAIITESGIHHPPFDFRPAPAVSSLPPVRP